MARPKGRPKQDTGKLSEQKTMMFSKEDMELIKKAAKARRLTATGLIRLAIFDFLKREGEIK